MRHVIDTATQLCAVIGNPIEHSLSPAMHNAAFAAADLNYVYLAFHVEDLEGCLRGMRALPSFRGMSVTIPHKLQIMEYLDRIEPMARHVGSVNTVTNENGSLVGSTTDGPGTLRAFADAGVSLNGKRVLFFGSGGAVRAVAFAFAELASPAHITILGRTPERVATIVNDLREKTPIPADAADLNDPAAVEDAMRTHGVIVQGTPVGMYPHEGESCVPAGVLRPSHVVFDMVYRPRQTRLITDAEGRGCTVIPGLEMLVNQAVLQFEAWTGTKAPLEVMRNALIEQLSS